MPAKESALLHENPDTEKTVAELLNMDPDKYSELSIHDLNLSTRAHNCICHYLDHPLMQPTGSKLTVDEILRLTISQLRNVRNLGSACFDEVLDALNSI